MRKHTDIYDDNKNIDRLINKRDKEITKLKTNTKTAQESYEMEISKLNKELKECDRVWEEQYREKVQILKKEIEELREWIKAVLTELKVKDFASVINKIRNFNKEKAFLEKEVRKLSKFETRRVRKLNKDIEKLNILKQGWKERSEFLDKEIEELKKWDNEMEKSRKRLLLKNVHLKAQNKELKKELKDINKSLSKIKVKGDVK